MIEWVTTHYKPKNGKPYTRLKATFGRWGASSVLIYVGTEGWVYKGEFQTEEDAKKYRYRGTVITDKNVRISMNGPLILTWSEWREIYLKIEETYNALCVTRIGGKCTSF
jgi:hypothetical protein